MDTLLWALSGIFHPPWWGIVLYTTVMTCIAFATVTIFLHRHLAHRALDLHPALVHFFRFTTWLLMAIITGEWAPIHRKHHAKCETVDDPHSPQIRGIKKVLLEGVELYRAEAKNPETLEKYGKNLPDDWLERNIYAKHSYAGVILMLLINIALFGSIGFTVWAVQMLWSPVFAAGVINGLGHWKSWFGYRNFETKDCSMNLGNLIALITCGEGHHNNHHRFPGSAKISYRWWEFDLGWLYIRILEVLGLARVNCIHDRRF